MKSFRQYTEEINPPEQDTEDKNLKSKEKKQAQIKKMVLLKKMQAVRAGAGADIVASHEPEGEMVEGLKQARKNVGADKCWDGYKAKGTKKKGGKEVPNCVKEGKKKGLWDNIHAKRKRGEKPAKPGDKDYPKTLNVEGAAWTKKSGKNKEGGLNEKGRKSYEADNPGSDLKAPSKKVGNPRRKSFCARMSGMKKKLTSAKTANDPDSRINKSLRKWNCSYEPDGTPIMEEDKAFNFVLDKIRKEVGKDGYVSKNNPRKPQTPQQKAKVRAHQAKVDKENAAARAKDPSQGRYPKG